MHTHVVWTCPCVHTQERKSFSIASCPTRLPRRSWGGGQRHYSAIKLLFAGVTLSGGCVDRGGNALKVHSYRHTHTHISFRQGCLRSGLRAPGRGSPAWWGVTGARRVAVGWARSGQEGVSGTPEDNRTGPVGRPPATPFHPWWIGLVSFLFPTFLLGTSTFFFITAARRVNCPLHTDHTFGYIYCIFALLYIKCGRKLLNEKSVMVPEELY